MKQNDFDDFLEYLFVTSQLDEDNNNKENDEEKEENDKGNNKTKYRRR